MTDSTETSKRAHDPVNHPMHYTSHPSGIETIEYTRLLPFGPGNAVKYVMRRGMKGDPMQDLDKAIWYLNDSRKYGVQYQVPEAATPLINAVLQAEPSPEVGAFLVTLYRPSPFDSTYGLKNGLSFDMAARIIQDLYAEQGHL